MYEIRKGLENGVDVTPYIQGLSYYEVREVRFTLEDGFDPEPLIAYKFSHFQMREIRFGMEAKIDIGSYYNPQTDYREMAFLRGQATQKKLTKPQTIYTVNQEENGRWFIYTLKGKQIQRYSKTYFDSNKLARQIGRASCRERVYVLV